jgi:pyruvate formate lyase activating enzyme
MSRSEGHVASFESFGSVDGPGLRFVVFLAGCPLRCAYCHNPEMWEPSAGNVMTPEEVLARAVRYRPYWKGGGGITVSGGEPLLQAEFVAALFSQAKSEGISTCLDTSGAIFPAAGRVSARPSSGCSRLLIWCCSTSRPWRKSSMNG